jgi:hypothetical protein
MATETAQRFCQSCQRNTLYVRHSTPVNHVLHLLLSVLVCGLWLPVWLLIVLCHQPYQAPLRCATCGAADVPADVPTAVENREGWKDLATLLAILSLAGGILWGLTVACR